MSCCCIIPVPQITRHKHARLLSWTTRTRTILDTACTIYGVRVVMLHDLSWILSQGANGQRDNIGRLLGDFVRNFKVVKGFFRRRYKAFS